MLSDYCFTERLLLIACHISGFTYCIARTVSGCGCLHVFEKKDNARELQEYALPCQHLSPEIRFLRNLAWKYAWVAEIGMFFLVCTCNLFAQEFIQAGLQGGTIQLCLNASQKKSPHSVD